MKPSRFEYWNPKSVDEAVAILDEHGADAKILAGGQSLIPVLSMRLARVEQLVDVNGIGDLSYIRQEGGQVRIGGLTRQHELMKSSVVAEQLPLLRAAVPYIGHTAIRYRGTIGGSLAHADPSAELPAVMVTLGAEIEIAGKRGRRTVPADEFFVTYFTTSVQPNEMVTEIRLPVQKHQASVVSELARRHGDFALSGIAVAVGTADRRTDAIDVTAFGVDEVPKRLTSVESLLSGQEPSEALLSQANRLAVEAVEPEADMHASSEYRRHVTGVLLERALKRAFADAGVEI